MTNREDLLEKKRFVSILITFTTVLGLCRMVLTQLTVEVFDLVFYDLRIIEARLVDHIHPSLDHKRVSWETSLVHLLLLDAKDAPVSVQVRYHEVEDVSRICFLETACQLEKEKTRKHGYGLLPC